MPEIFFFFCKYLVKKISCRYFSVREGLFTGKDRRMFIECVVSEQENKDMNKQ